MPGFSVNRVVFKGISRYTLSICAVVTVAVPTYMMAYMVNILPMGVYVVVELIGEPLDIFNSEYRVLVIFEYI